MPDDRTLVEATLRGEMEAFGQLVRRHQQPLLAAACHLLRSVADAEDLVQETFLTAYQRLRQLREQEKFRPWLFTILRHKCQDFLRSRRAAECSLESCTDIPADTRELSDHELLDMLNRLPYADREVLVARYLYELEYEDLARTLGCSIRAARMRCQRARERLRALLLKADEEETSRLVQRATRALAIGMLGDGFAYRILQEVKPMEMTMPIHPAPPARPLRGRGR